MVNVVLKEGVNWVGVVDWNIRDFHGYITRRGSSYNAYLISDEKTALIDTVKSTFCNELVEHISELTSLEKIDYIIVNHVEMDHSSSLPVIAKLCEKRKDNFFAERKRRTNQALWDRIRCWLKP